MKPILTVAAAALLAGGSFAYAQNSGTGTQAMPAAGQSEGAMKMQPEGGATNTEQAPAGTAGGVMSKISTATFIETVPGANMFEIESSKLALERASADDVKTFAQQMITDHTKAGQDFKAALEKVETTAATKPSGTVMDDAQRTKLDELKAAKGEAFQAKYIQMQADAHKEAVALFSTYANSGDDPALKEFAKATLPTLQMHEKHVKALQAAHRG